jgi:hypothetical protein
MSLLSVCIIKVGQTSLAELGNSHPRGGWNSVMKKMSILKAIYCLANRKVVLKNRQLALVWEEYIKLGITLLLR